MTTQKRAAAKKAAAKKTTAKSPKAPSGNPLLIGRRRELVWLSAGADAVRIDEIEDELNGLLALPRRTGAEKLRTKKLIDERNELCGDGLASRVRVVLEEPPYRGYTGADGVEVVGFTDLQADHPPRQGHQIDARLGFNADTYPAALIRLCMVEPVVTDEQWAEFIPGGGPNAVSAYNWAKLTDVASDLTNREARLPKPLPVSALLQTSDDE